MSTRPPSEDDLKGQPLGSNPRTLDPTFAIATANDSKSHPPDSKGQILALNFRLGRCCLRSAVACRVRPLDQQALRVDVRMRYLQRFR